MRGIQIKRGRALGTANESTFYSKRCSAKHSTSTFSAGHTVPTKEGDIFLGRGEGEGTTDSWVKGHSPHGG